MLFATHLVIGALVARHRSYPLWWAVTGAALPDVLDKPLASAGYVELFHTVGHSALLLPLAVGVALVDRRGLALAVGWGLHVVADAVHVVINGRPTDALFLGWPLVTPPTPLAIPPGEFFWYYLWSPSFFLEVGIWLVAGWGVFRTLGDRRRTPA